MFAALGMAVILGTVSGVTTSCERGASADTTQYRVLTFERPTADATPRRFVSIKFQYPDITWMRSLSATDSVSAAIKTFLIAAMSEGSLPRDLPSFVDNIDQQYEALQRDFPDYATEWTVERNVDIVFNAPHTLCLRMDEYTFTGGAHGNASRKYTIRDARTGEPVGAEKIFVDGYREELNRLGEIAFREVRQLEPDEPLNDAGFSFSQNQFALNDNVGVTRDGIVFYFNDYEIGPHVFGPTLVLLPFDRIGGLLDHASDLGRDIDAYTRWLKELGR